MPARMRAWTYSRERFSRTTQSMPWSVSRRDSSRPAGPAPMIPTWVRMARVSPWPASLGTRIFRSAEVAGAGELPPDAAGGHLEHRDEAWQIAAVGWDDDAQRGHHDRAPFALDAHGHRERGRTRGHLLRRAGVAATPHLGQLAPQPSGV